MSDFGTVAARAADSVGPSEARPALAWGEALSGHAGVALVFVQLVFVALVAQQADLLGPMGRRILDLAAGAFLVHHLLPVRYRLKAFVVLCGIGLLHALGASPWEFWDGAKGIEGGAAVLAVGGALAGICLLPLGFWTRAGLLGAAGAAVALLRHGSIGPRSLAFVWPVLAGMVMFRIVIYLHQVSTLKRRPSLEQTLAYLFLLPNTYSGLVPVVDFKTFLRSHYDSDALAIYQRGVRWIVRGLIQLVCYRLVQLVVVRPEDVANGTQLIGYVLGNAFMYVRVSGQFHIFVGLLLLFGFNLPETNHRYFLASSFTEYWRRANIYWKDFILNVFYYPTYFRLKRWPMTALVVATVWSFLVTWALHQYQTWWLQGSTVLTAQDGLFWGALGVLVLVNSVWEIKRGRTRKLASSAYTLRQAAGLIVRTAATFTCISVLWSLWSAASVSQWVGLWRFADLGTLAWGGAVLGAIAIATIAFEIAPFSRPAAAAGSAFGVQALARSAVPLVAIYVLSSPAFQARADYEFLQPVYDALNLGDTAALAEGNGNYYERLIDGNRTQAQVWEPTILQRPSRVYLGADPVRAVKDFRFHEFLPNVHLRAYDTDFATNLWGMRDRDRALAKPPGVVRIAVVGASHAMGWGVPEEDVFETRLERRLNAAEAAGPGVRFEVLNFAVYNYSPLGAIASLQQNAARFSPDIVLLVTHKIDGEWSARDLARGIRERLPIPDPALTGIARQARLARTTPPVLAMRRLRPFEPELLDWAYRAFARDARLIGATPVIAFIPTPDDLPMDPAAAAAQTTIIAKSGAVLVDFTHLYDGERPADLMVKEMFDHSNARAHALIASGLYEALTTDPAIHLGRFPERQGHGN